MSRDTSRVSALNERARTQDGRYVLYFMQHSQRAAHNPALEHAISVANDCGLPLLTVFAVDPDYPEANARHYTFMLEGIKETAAAITKRGAHFSLRKGTPPDIAAALAKDAAAVVTDRGYLRHLVAWREALAEDAPCAVEMVEGDVIVPVAVASPKKETAARTIRPKLKRALGDWLALPDRIPLKAKARGLASADDRDLSDLAAFVAGLGCDASVGPAPGFRGGTGEARARLKRFVDQRLKGYGSDRADMVNRHVSELSPYLHFGQISPLEVYHAVKDAKPPQDAEDSFIDEMLTRRELAVNFVHNEPNYDKYSALPEWARNTLADHADDPRDRVYTTQEMEDGKTDDPYWNAAMKEMRVTGYLHNHMRMYWGKRIIAYTNTPEHAFRTALSLNNKYLLDGRDANSYANVAWLFGIHDRGWPERAVFGKVRTMMPSGLKRKFDIEAYVRWARDLRS
ncbi:MAG: deoxyribodipyrimidine photo-lyase [Pseudomonadota bacterium]